MGLIWSMEPDPASRPSSGRVDYLAPTSLSLVAEVAGERASAAWRRS